MQWQNGLYLLMAKDRDKYGQHQFGDYEVVFVTDDKEKTCQAAVDALAEDPSANAILVNWQLGWGIKHTKVILRTGEGLDIQDLSLWHYKPDSYAKILAAVEAAIVQSVEAALTEPKTVEGDN